MNGALLHIIMFPGHCQTWFTHTRKYRYISCLPQPKLHQKVSSEQPTRDHHLVSRLAKPELVLLSYVLVPLHWTQIVNNKWNIFWNCWGLLFTSGAVKSQTWISGLWPFTLMELLIGVSYILQFPWPQLIAEIRNRMQEKCTVSLKEILERIPWWISWKLSLGCKWNLIYNQKIHLWFYK